MNLADQFRQQCSSAFPETPEQGTLDVTEMYAAYPLGEPYMGNDEVSQAAAVRK